ncbi:MAG: helix-turn-helix domain-containing protein [Bilophila wadsworthia]
MTQSEFATRLRTPLTTLGRYERGANMPDLAFIINVCTIFDVSPEWLLFARCNARTIKGISFFRMAAASALW